MTTYTIPKGNKKAIENFVLDFYKLAEERDLIIALDHSSGTASAPTKRKNHYKSLPFALAPDVFTKKGNNDFLLCKYKGIALFFFEEGAVNHEEETS